MKCLLRREGGNFCTEQQQQWGRKENDQMDFLPRFLHLCTTMTKGGLTMPVMRQALGYVQEVVELDKSLNMFKTEYDLDLNARKVIIPAGADY